MSSLAPKTAGIALSLLTLGAAACSSDSGVSGGVAGQSGSTGGGTKSGAAGGGNVGVTPAGGGAGSSAGGVGNSATSGAGAGATAGMVAMGGAAGSGSAADGGSAGAGPAGQDGCAGRDLLLCEDFESTDLGATPSGWTRHGELAAVNDSDAHSGSRALRLGPAANAERRIYHDAKLLGSAHWGRIYFKVETPVPDAFVHSTLVSLMGDGPKNGRSDYRPIDTIKQAKNTPDVGGRHNFIYNVQIIGKSEFGTETNYDYTFDAKWHCAEYHIDASNQSYTLYLDGKSILSFERGAGNYDQSDIPNGFDEVRVGWINYQSASPGFT